MTNLKRPIVWLIFAAIILLIGAGFIFVNNFSNSTQSPETEVVEDPTVVSQNTVEPAADEETSAEEAVIEEEETPVESDGEIEATSEENDEAQEPEPDEAAQQDPDILTDDNRPERLRILTQAWETNWERRTIEYDEILSGGPPRDGIPSIDDPKFIEQDEAAEWLADNEPVIALEIDGDARAYPLQVVTWHEIVNDTVGDVPVIVTFCPLCNSALVFDRRFEDQTFEFGVSGLLRNSDLIMYDRTTETLWQQFTGEGVVGDLAGEQLTFLPSSLISFKDFREAYPEGVVLSRDTGFNRAYGQNPYVGYDTTGNDPFLFNGPTDGRLDAVERVVTVSLPDVGLDIAYPLSILVEMGVINDMQGGQDLVVFHTDGTSSALGAGEIAQGEDVGATGVFNPNLNGQKLTFIKEGGQIIDEETASTWNIVGQAIDGPLAGEALAPIVHGDHFWFSWAAFKPDTIIFGSEAS